ncbi:5'-methylthioadenosine phosphorylase [Vogesella sp. EB]|jgi:5'-methylthioadenosine phosphorylase|uniref:Probable S-methyl-5'-thioinosine phosphorylase n=1 Tax=Vogesella indigofera TaxID=45465 RepID=A0A495BP53_VOGIN|nr:MULTISPECIES: S-methyl-5'-thioinosine phosphorylase [Vogesella]KMJ52059.1 5'-methylthioadenosine phosphorylase [Vogesella sp. EB]RKQ62121.1 methylthioadenosine phosphorylase [Vogesella indigofera]
MLAIIGGSSLAKLPILEVTHRQVVRTPYGDPSCALTFGRIGMQNVVFIARHGYGNSIAPHEINYRANIWALHSVGVKGVIAIGSVGGIRPDMVPGSLVIPDNIVDYSWGRKHTFFEGPEKPVVHVDFTWPFDRELRARLVQTGREAGLSVIDGAVYACTQGPRLESAAEIRRVEQDGADMVGMTGMPEAALARELALPYANLSLVVNWAAGKGNSSETVALPETVFEHGVSKILAVLTQLAK